MQATAQNLSGLGGLGELGKGAKIGKSKAKKPAKVRSLPKPKSNKKLKLPPPLNPFEVSMPVALPTGTTIVLNEPPPVMTTPPQIFIPEVVYPYVPPTPYVPPVQEIPGQGKYSRTLDTINKAIGAISGRTPAGGYEVETHTDYGDPSSLRNPRTALERRAGTDIGEKAGRGVGGIVDTISEIVTEHPFAVGGGLLALFLLYKQPPSRRR
jgi:hypothetical protein